MLSAGTGWEKVDGRLKWISSGASGEVWGVNNADIIYRREGVTQGNPTGTGWKQLNGRLAQVDVFGGEVWGVNGDENIYSSKLV